jgi:hypothetical protein
VEEADERGKFGLRCNRGATGSRFIPVINRSLSSTNLGGSEVRVYSEIGGRDTVVVDGRYVGVSVDQSFDRLSTIALHCDVL